MLFVAGWIGACTRSAESAHDTESRFASRLQKIATEYKSYGRADDRLRWAPAFCLLPPPPHARISEAKPDSPHGRKLYYVYARNPIAYDSSSEQPTGQAIVKEAWTPEPCELPFAPEELNRGRMDMTRPIETDAAGSYVPYAVADGKGFRAGEQAGLYIMYKVDAAEPGTDRGWVYGTLAADGRTVTAAGRIASCIACHEAAPRDRMFGLNR